MLPFLATELGLLVKSLMARFVKHSIIDSCKSVASLTKVEFEKTDNHMDCSKFDFGFCAKTTPRSKNISDQNRHVFRYECRDVLVAILKKIMSKAPSTVRTEYRAACEDIAGGGSTAEYENFNPSVHRLDKLLFPVLGTNPNYASLWITIVNFQFHEKQ